MEHYHNKHRHFLLTGLLVLCTVLARVFFLWWKPEHAVSVDVHSWETVAEILRSGGNPYDQTTFLNWPPVWPVTIYLVSILSEGSGASFRDLLFGLLAMFDCALATGVYLVSVHTFHRPKPKAFLTSLFGIALSPILILLSCQHGNFDVMAVLCILASLFLLNDAIAKQSLATWHRACLLLGLAGAVKTFPLILAPLFVLSFPARKRASLLWASLFIVMPWLLGIGAIYWTAPDAVWKNVVMYNSVPSLFGFNAIFKEVFGEAARNAHTAIFLAVITLVYRAIIPVLRQGYSSSLLFVAAALLLTAIPALGPGFGPQYILWSIPLWTAIFPVLSRGQKSGVMACYGLVTFSYLYLYGFVTLYGASVGPPVFLVTVPVLLAQVALFGAFVSLLLLGCKLVGDVSSTPSVRQ